MLILVSLAAFVALASAVLEPIPPPTPCTALCRMFYSLLDQNGDGYASLGDLVRYYDALDSRLIGSRNIERVKGMCLVCAITIRSCS